MSLLPIHYFIIIFSINGTLHYSEKLVCDKTVGWNNGVEKSVTVKGAEDDFTVECVGKGKFSVKIISSKSEIHVYSLR